MRRAVSPFATLLPALNGGSLRIFWSGPFVTMLGASKHMLHAHSTVTLLARFRGLSTSRFFSVAMW
jgi:hypothetical protein